MNILVHIIKNLILVTFIVFLFNYGCKSPERETDFTLDDFKAYNVELSTEDILPDSVTVGYSTWMTLLNDSVLAIVDFKGNEQVLLYNIKNGKSRHIVPVGQGPEEASLVHSLWTNGDTLFVMCSNDKKVLGFTIDGLTLQPTLTEAYHIPELCTTAQSLPNGKVILFPLIMEPHKFYILDKKTGKCDTIMHPYVFPDKTLPSNEGIQGIMALSEDKSQLFFSYLFLGRIEVYDTDSFKCTAFSGPVAATVTQREVNNGGGTSIALDTDWITYGLVKAYKDGFIVTYTGKKITDVRDYNTFPSMLLSFSRDGKPRNLYKLSHEITAFAVDDKNNLLYYIIEDPDPKLGVVKLPE